MRIDSREVKDENEDKTPHQEDRRSNSRSVPQFKLDFDFDFDFDLTSPSPDQLKASPELGGELSTTSSKLEGETGQSTPKPKPKPSKPQPVIVISSDDSDHEPPKSSWKGKEKDIGMGNRCRQGMQVHVSLSSHCDYHSYVDCKQWPASYYFVELDACYTEYAKTSDSGRPVSHKALFEKYFPGLDWRRHDSAYYENRQQ